ncbi:phosphatase PAP2 family protein [Dactylosporangium roseum]|uniref:Phosphatase PAP2 family protein n=1 Tax=Dactylosporangium roseum TaxID=47989 RepID=A0ABY5ZGU1_9ACTN|nr:phosphatase PAP2 family protein [Dactylosporangium roseum]UWZ39972.1 phosphatase PAP2 family protein [Dactylosporangium roseum]
MRGWPVGLVLWLLLLAVAGTVGFVEVWRFFVQTEQGQLLDYVALTGNSIGRARVESIVDNTLNGISVLSLAVATVVIGFIALARRRVALAVGAVLLIGGANATTQVLKAVIYRPDLGVDVERAAAGNSLPSGHTTVAASVAVAFVLVLPARTRGPGALVAALFAALAGVATLSAGWHRPSDAVAALLIVGAWAAVTGLFIVLAQRRHGGVEYGPPSTYMTLFLALVSLGLLAGAGLALYLTNDVVTTAVEDLGRRRLFAAYAGGALGIAGTAGLTVASVLATVHRVVPRVVPPDPEEPADEPPTVRLLGADDTPTVRLAAEEPPEARR